MKADELFYWVNGVTNFISHVKSSPFLEINHTNKSKDAFIFRRDWYTNLNMSSNTNLPPAAQHWRVPSADPGLDPGEGRVSVVVSVEHLRGSSPGTERQGLLASPHLASQHRSLAVFFTTCTSLYFVTIVLWPNINVTQWLQTNRHIRLRELLLEHSRAASLIVM